MKNFQKLLSTTLVLFLAITSFSCSKDDEEIATEVGVIGVWTVQSADITLDGKSLTSYIEESINQMKSQLGQQYSDEMGEAFAESFESFDMSGEFEGNTIEFKSENNVVIVTDEDGSEEGTWSLSDKLITVTIDGDSQTFEVRSMTSSTAAFVMAFEEMDDMQMESPLKIEVTMNLKK